MRTFLLSLCAVCLVLFSHQAMSAASRAAEVFVSGVLPALFPMMVVSRLLPPGCGSLWQTALFGFLSGSPASAQRVDQLCRCGKAKDPEMLLCLCGVMSPMFFTGSIARWTGDAGSAWTLLLLHWLSAMIAAALWKLFSTPFSPAGQETAAPPRLAAAIRQSAEAMLGVCGAMMLFSIAAGVLRHGLQLLFPAWTAQHALLLNALWAVVEIGGGAAALAQPPVPWALLGALCSFGGLSIWLQNLLFMPQSIRPAKLLWMRMLHGAICYGLGLITFS